MECRGMVWFFFSTLQSSGKKYNLTPEETSSALEFANEMYSNTGFSAQFQNKSLPSAKSNGFTQNNEICNFKNQDMYY